MDLLLAGGGPCPLSLTDLTARLGCARKSVLQALRLGEELGLLRGAPGPRVDGRRGPAPTAWALGLAAGSATGSWAPPVAPSEGEGAVRTGGEALPEDAGERGHELPSGAGVAPETGAGGDRRQPVSSAPIPGSDSPDSKDLVTDLIQRAATRTHERQPSRMARCMGPVLAGLVRDGWAAADLRALVDEAIEATAAYRPAYPASYLARVLEQRLGRGYPPAGRSSEARPAHGAMCGLDGVSRETAGGLPGAAPALAVATAVDQAEAASPRCRPRRLPIPAPSGVLPLSAEALWRAALDDLVRRQPREAQYLAASAGVGCDGEQFFVRVPSVWVADRLEGRLRREVEAVLQVLTGRSMTIACVVPPADEPAAVRLAV
ncbi:MAG: hypothetical protein IT340_22340 [Chloroflexi bacterium]|nr:hypothetical protein [Chloroflexota bacterium]